MPALRLMALATKEGPHAPVNYDGFGKSHFLSVNNL